MLSGEQRAILLRPINPDRVLEAQGQSHLPAFDVVAHLNRVFGFEGWDKEIIDLWLISEASRAHPERAERTQYTVTYGCRMSLTIFALPDWNASERVKVKRIEEAATGSANNLPSLGDAHDFAMKNAISYALKRCAKDLGDQFGLSLYNKGSRKALVQKVIPYGEPSEAKADWDIEKPRTLGNDEREQPDAQD
jgi:recombination DNA repair RAD52 pathway protein